LKNLPNEEKMNLRPEETNQRLQRLDLHLVPNHLLYFHLVLWPEIVFKKKVSNMMF
jgi:hypothetical protein